MKLVHGILSLATLAITSPRPSVLVSGFATPRASRAPPSHHRLHQSSSLDNDAPLDNLARPTMPSHSPATRLPNQIYQWRGYQIRYQVSGPPDADHTLLLIHGLFVNSDHWRKTLTGLPSLREMEEKGQTCRVYAIDLLGSGWSSKPNREDVMARAVNGENGRFVDCDSVCYRETQRQEEQLPMQQQLSKTTRAKKRLQKIRTKAILNNVPLGTASGGKRMASALELRHPLGSPYNFYTWAEQITDFVHDVIHEDHYRHHHHDSRSSTPNDNHDDNPPPPPKVTLVANSIGTMSSLQSILDEPHLFDGCLIINPNFRELHMAEVPFSRLSMPLVRRIQAFLRTHGRSLYDSLATPSTVKEILKEPYAVREAIDDELIDVLLTPLLTEGAADVVFDTLSYSAGPLPEQQLGSRFFPAGECPVWVVYGKSDPWTLGRRVEGLRDVGGCHDGEGGGPTMTRKTRNDRYGVNYGGGGRFGGPVERVVGLEGVGHCPHDESPEEVNRLIWEFLDRISTA